MLVVGRPPLLLQQSCENTAEKDTIVVVDPNSFEAGAELVPESGRSESNKKGPGSRTRALQGPLRGLRRPLGYDLARVRVEVVPADDAGLRQ